MVHQILQLEGVLLESHRAVDIRQAVVDNLLQHRVDKRLQKGGIPVVQNSTCIFLNIVIKNIPLVVDIRHRVDNSGKTFSLQETFLQAAPVTLALT